MSIPNFTSRHNLDNLARVLNGPVWIGSAGLGGDFSNLVRSAKLASPATSPFRDLLDAVSTAHRQPNMTHLAVAHPPPSYRV